MDGDGDDSRGSSSGVAQIHMRGQSKNIAKQFKTIDNMLNVIDKLKLLKYEDEFLKLTKLPRLHRLYFVFATNPGEQYYNFVTLSAWLIQKCSRNIAIPQESDDPNEVISRILSEIRELGGVIDFPQSKVRAGSGPEVVKVLDFLTDRALELGGYKFLTPKFPIKATATDERDDYEVDMSKIENDMSNRYVPEEEVTTIVPEAAEGSGLIGVPPPPPPPEEKPDEPEDEESTKIVTEISPEEWRMEVERVLPQLSIPVVDDTYDWSKRQVQFKALAEQVSGVVEQSRLPMKKLAADIHESIEKLSAREATLSKHAEVSLSELAATQDKVSKLREKQKGLNAEIIEKNKELARLSDDVEASRKKLDERGSVMADGAPVTQARKDLAILKQEISNMDVEVGVMEHYILKSMVQEQAAYRAKN